MKILIACEFSGVVREAFSAKGGHDVCSCDLLPTEIDGQHHQGDVIDFIYAKNWDLLIAHPPCTFILNSGCKWLYDGGKRWNTDGSENPRDPKRWQAMVDGALFFKRILNAPIRRKCIENPIMVGHAKAIIGMDQTQTIQPWQFGHGETKATCLWLIGLPPLKPTNIVSGREQRIHKMSPGLNRSKERSRTYAGIARAMADQWSNLL